MTMAEMRVLEFAQAGEPELPSVEERVSELADRVGRIEAVVEATPTPE